MKTRLLIIVGILLTSITITIFIIIPSIQKADSDSVSVMVDNTMDSQYATNKNSESTLQTIMSIGDRITTNNTVSQTRDLEVILNLGTMFIAYPHLQLIRKWKIATKHQKHFSMTGQSVGLYYESSCNFSCIDRIY